MHPILASYFSHILLRRTSIRSFLICVVAFKRRKASSFVIIVFIRVILFIDGKDTINFAIMQGNREKCADLSTLTLTLTGYPQMLDR